MSKYPYRFHASMGNPIRALLHQFTHRRTGTQLICDAVVLGLAAVLLDFFVLFVRLVVDSVAIESEPPALIGGFGIMFVRALAIASVVVGGVGFIRFAREGADTMANPRQQDSYDALPAPRPQQHQQQQKQPAPQRDAA